jgi:hypothetical protein
MGIFVPFNWKNIKEKKHNATSHSSRPSGACTQGLRSTRDVAIGARNKKNFDLGDGTPQRECDRFHEECEKKVDTQAAGNYRRTTN